MLGPKRTSAHSGLTIRRQAAATPCAIAGDQLWDTYLILKPQLEAIAADTTGDNDPSVLAAMSDGYSRIIDGWEKYFSTATIAFAVIAVLPFLISVVRSSEERVCDWS